LVDAYSQETLTLLKGYTMKEDFSISRLSILNVIYLLGSERCHGHANWDEKSSK